jgi:CO/xanthine dehydrogenase Mo-binding subunit
MSERILLKDGAVITAHLGDYKLPTTMDKPELETVLLPGGGGAAPFSTTAISEMSNVALPAAITMQCSMQWPCDCANCRSARKRCSKV